ncbi:MAG: hypothetical protein KKF41_03380 [Actinobacteria bacterium]|nr:hypothetical protein [Actinomycetota bacterium]MBU1945056.1 hypothetical protein [Actinomycetota bacterium]MBU2686608.1 hypothetical protein [Actinomycetota bacterium]
MDLYVVRHISESFFNVIVVGSAAALAAVATYTAITRKRNFAVMAAVGFLLGFAFEAISVAVGFRDLSAVTVFGVRMPYPFPQVVMGLEGGVLIPLAGYWIGHCLARRKYARAGGALAAVAVYSLAGCALTRYEIVRGAREITSRREVFGPVAAVSLIVMVLVVAYALWKMQASGRRMFLLFLLGVFVVSSVWILGYRGFGLRVFEQLRSGGYVPASGPATAVGLLYDIVVELTLIDALFFLVPYSLGMLDVTEWSLTGDLRPRAPDDRTARVGR